MTCMFSTLWPLTHRVALDDPGEVPRRLARAGRRATAPRSPRRAGQQPVRRRGAGRGRETFVELLRAHRRAAPAVRGEGDRVPDRGPRGDQRACRSGGATSMRSRCRTGTRSRSPSTSSGTRRNGINLGRSIPILGTRGCPFQCTFCSNPGHVDASAGSRANPVCAGRRDGALRSQVPGDELRLPGPHVAS